MKDTTDIHKVFAKHIGTDKNLRAAAYAVSKKLEDGHICIDPEAYSQELQQHEGSRYARSNPFLFENETIDIIKLLGNNYIDDNGNSIKPFVFVNGKLYLQRFYKYETEIIEGIENLCNQTDVLDSTKLLEHKELFGSIFDLQKKEVETEIDWQMVATIRAMMTRFMIITGGPGTGKTTTVAKILGLMFSVYPEIKVALAAPTGKAASRLNGSLSEVRNILKGITPKTLEKFGQIKASTIHRLLGNRRNSPYFRHNKEHPLEHDLVIVDESSMIDATLMAKLINAIHPKSRLILLGDKDQLASVEAGSIFGDLCLTQSASINYQTAETTELINSIIPDSAAKISSLKTAEGGLNVLSENIIELIKSYRFKKYDGIGRLSKAIINGNLEDFNAIRNEDAKGIRIVSKFDFEKISQNKEFINEIEKFKEYINEDDTLEALKKINNIRVLCAVNQGKFGVSHFNDIVEAYLKNQGYLLPEMNFYQNQPILITKNDYSLGLFNGDVGIIRKGVDNELKAYFEGVDENGEIELREVLPGFINGFKTVFAMTIHKSQGSEFERAVIVLPEKEEIPILTRELLYTGVTRAKEHALLIAVDAVIRETINRKVSRASGIRERINKKTKPA